MSDQANGRLEGIPRPTGIRHEDGWYCPPAGVFASLFRDGRWVCRSDSFLPDDLWPRWPDWNPFPRIHLFRRSNR